MMKYLAGVLSVIALGTLLIAYGLLNPRVAVAEGAMLSRPMVSSDRVQLLDQGGGYQAVPVAQQLAFTSAGARPIPAVNDYPAPRRAAVRPIDDRRESAPRVAARDRGRDWKTAAMIIGGSSAAGAGLGAIIGGRKGALIGAAIGGGASTIYEVRKQ